MVVLAASICTKGGKAVISRQFRDMSRQRIESLLASFPKLIPPSTQHTTVETAEVRYVYQPLEDLYILLITNKASNILQDIDTLHLFARVVSDMCRSADEREILLRAFEILGAFDEVVSLGYRENVGLMQVRSVLEMESHEEKIQEIIARNKEAEAKEELKRRAKQLEMQRREQQRRASSNPALNNPNAYLGGSGSNSNSNFNSNSSFGGSGIGGGVSGYSPVSRYDSPDATPSTNYGSSRHGSSASPAPGARAPAFKGAGMKLGSKKTKQAELLDSLGGDLLGASPAEQVGLLGTGAGLDSSAPPTPSVSAGPVTKTVAGGAGGTGAGGRGSVPEVEAESIHILIREQLTLSLLRDGGVQALELKGDMNLHITDPEKAHVRVELGELGEGFAGNALQFKQHPNVAKFAPASAGTPRVVALKDPARAFPVGQSLAVLKWRYAGTDESVVPLSINCWPSPSNDGTCEVSIEYELENEGLTLYDVVISIPLPDGSYPTVSSHTGDWALNPTSHSLAWSIPRISSSSTSPGEEDTQSGSLIFTVGGDDVGAFFPVEVAFVAEGSLAGVKVAGVTNTKGGEEQVFSVDSVLNVEEYLVV